ncbi:pyrroline-5-carboxylate reductase [Pinibacter soli]|uniref:Pyrroline-5-carboxylate reductase n=1 Tax=Pinibacter soli TaxID=3044211 RepID=A0ABT6RBQ3_9BACT|nr:pyrroline-5-carboxylate reductase [Pinibacter soli]MDI3319891.1 pyrroline-5-carboxylate reductase [Pinibacter soli]
MYNKIAIIGGGNLGTAIAEGLLKSEFSKPADITITRRNLTELEGLKNKGVKVTSDNIEAVKNSDVVILAVKPFQIKDVLDGFKAELDPQKHILVSVITGIFIEDMQNAVQKNVPLFRAMPNTAIAIQESMTCISHKGANNTQVDFIKNIFEKLGKVAMIDEKLMDAATVLGACGTAFAMRYIRANIQGGIEIGFSAATASLIAAQTVKGAADLLLLKGAHPEQEIDKVTTPKGCTIAGLNEMEHQGFSSSLIRGVVTSYNKILNS